MLILSVSCRIAQFLGLLMTYILRSSVKSYWKAVKLSLSSLPRHKKRRRGTSRSWPLSNSALILSINIYLRSPILTSFSMSVVMVIVGSLIKPILTFYRKNKKQLVIHLPNSMLFTYPYKALGRCLLRKHPLQLIILVIVHWVVYASDGNAIINTRRVNARRETFLRHFQLTRLHQCLRLLVRFLAGVLQQSPNLFMTVDTRFPKFFAPFRQAFSAQRRLVSRCPLDALARRLPLYNRLDVMVYEELDREICGSRMWWRCTRRLLLRPSSLPMTVGSAGILGAVLSWSGSSLSTVLYVLLVLVDAFVARL